MAEPINDVAQLYLPGKNVTISDYNSQPNIFFVVALLGGLIFWPQISKLFKRRRSV